MLIDINIHAIDPPDPDLVYANNLETCRRAGVTPVSREQAFGLIQEWTGVLSGRPEPTTHKRAVLIGVVVTDRVVVAAVHTADMY